MMFPFAAFGCFNFDPRKLSIKPIDDTERESSEKSRAGVAKHKSRSRATTDDEACNRNLVWRESCFPKERDYCGFDWRVDISGKIQGAFLRRIHNNALSKTAVLCRWRRKTEWPDAPAHADDVIINFRRVQGVNFTILNLLFERLNKWGVVRARQKEVTCHQSRPARVLHHACCELRRIGIDKCSPRLPGAERSKQTPIAVNVCRDEEKAIHLTLLQNKGGRNRFT